MTAEDVPHPVVNVRGREVSIMLPGELKEIESLFFQAELVDGECDNNAYSFANKSPWSVKIEMRNSIEPNAKLRIQTVVETKNKIASQFSEYSINDKGIGELLDGPSLTSSTDLSDLIAKCKPVKKSPAETLSECSHRSGFSGGDLLFEDNFNNDQKLTDNWKHEVRYRNTGGKNQEFVAFVDDPNNSNVTNNKLHISITKDERDKILLGCTSKKEGLAKRKECGRSSGRSKREPWVSKTFRSANMHTNFTFKYGRVEIRAKMPTGDWLFPNILLVPNIEKSDDDFVDHIRLYVRGNSVLQDKHQSSLAGNSLFGGIVVWNKTGSEPNPSEHFVIRNEEYYYGDGFHDYTIIWQADKIIFKFNGEFFGAVHNATLLEPFQKHECHLVLGLTAGGNVNFNDDILDMQHKPFSNTHPKADKQFEELARNWNWTPLVVDHIRVYAIDKEGN
ncbi:gram-negative bacteria-binding protein 2-like [Drosophila santomea]|uniref:gram-negative bacteria-binding protein 2-like n=1 Tax=Drosophila santomea TaxID=129105 RepID=UPI001952C553|nr:gram-negative bacteria-binding protein 2-like [Drosophila santomea]